MRAGKLDRTIRIDKWDEAPEPDDFGTVKPNFTPLATLRAQIMQSSTEEFIEAQGATDDTLIVFRTRWLPGVTTADRVHYDGKDFNIKETKEIGRRKALELRAVNAK
ncbi:phage head closure protein [Rhizobium sp. Root483D2]|uniref:phage head closure protein n=1 Tax=Rhizobium sp. Root483D2 TaxID=1736545 RepID=UPI0007139405|nr:phage head closure protein [Rhizobium sp. Root483D2]KQY21025.1 head-tail adaptor protein [Rhizobium sp. Root483D2]